MKKYPCLQTREGAPFLWRFAVAACVSLLVSPALSAQTLGRQVVQGCIPTAVTRLNLQPTNVLAGTQQLRLAFSLPLRNPEAASNLLQQIYDPASPNYHHYLTPQEFTEQFSPSQQDYEAVIDFAKAHGLSVVGTYPNRLLVDVSGSVADIEKVFQVKMEVYPHPVEKRTFYAPNVEPSLALSVPVSGIVGLNNYRLPRPLYHVASAGEMATNRTMTGSAPFGYGSYFGSDFRNAYVPGTSLTGSGQTVALFECAGYFTNDIATYVSLAGLPSIPLQNVLVDGGPPAPYTGDNVNVEVALDIEMAMDMAPGLSKIIVYEGPGDTPAVDGDILNQIASDNLAKQISSSWVIGDSPEYATIYTEFALQGQTFLQASGDEGAYYNGIFQFEDSPLVTLVGGTTLTTSSRGAWSSEKVWNWGGGTAGGGGVSTVYAIPSWQTNLNMTLNQGSVNYRNVPDVALTADNIFVIADDGYIYPDIGGTSAAAPLWAGFVALINQQATDGGLPPVGFINPAVYAVGKGESYDSTFHDIRFGNNTTPFSLDKYFAVSGYDLCTGWGTPKGTNLINALTQPPDALRIAPASTFAASFSVGQLFGVVSQNYTLTNTSDSSLDWSLVNTSLWLNASPIGGTLASHGQTNVAVNLNATAASLPIGSYAGTLRFNDVTSGRSQSRSVALQVSPLVSNGGFETGDFTNWTLSGNVTNMFVTDSATFVHSGKYAARLGPVGSLGFLSETVPTVAGQTYTLSFWLENPNGGLPNEFNASWNGGTILDETNLPAFAWINLQFTVKATSNASVLQFGARNDPQFFNLDDVSVTLKPLPAFNMLSVNGNQLTLSWNATSGTVYQLQYTTNLARPNWVDLGGPVTGADATVSAMMPIAPDPQRFFRFQILP